MNCTQVLGEQRKMWKEEEENNSRMCVVIKMLHFQVVLATFLHIERE